LGKIKEYKLVKLIIGFIFKNEAIFIKSKNILCKKFGRVDFESPEINFNHTDHYKREMGGGLKKKFISFARLISMQDLSKIKLYTNKLEHKFSINKMRQINIDPGYLDSAKLVLATTKDYAHRIFLSKGIFGEVTLTYRGSSFVDNDWTYTDYRSKEYIKIFNQMRSLYLPVK